MTKEDNNGWTTLNSAEDLPKKSGWFRTIDHNSNYVNHTTRFTVGDDPECWLSCYSHWKDLPNEPLPFDLNVK